MVGELGAAIRAVHRGRSYLDVSLRQGDLAGLLGEAQSGAAGSAKPEKLALSERERQVLKLLALGYTYRATAEKLNLSEKSVETYRARLIQKLGISSRAGLVRYALLSGLLDDENL